MNPPLHEKIQAARVPVADAERSVQLHDPHREEVGKRHPAEPKVERPEGEGSRTITPLIGACEVTQAEKQESNGG
jgi:hypothetical protein